MTRSATTRSVGEIAANQNLKEGEVMFSKADLKKHLDKCTAALGRVHEANADWKSALHAAENAGIPKKELKFLIKNQTNPASDDFKATVNIMREMLGHGPLFSFADEQEEKKKGNTTH